MPSRPARALWIEIILFLSVFIFLYASRPARALWIEIKCYPYICPQRIVEAREGLVD